MRLACDEMLLRVGKWLRAAGYDTAIAPRGAPDEAVVQLAASEERLLLTCDKRMLPLLEAAPIAWLMLATSRARDAVPVLVDTLGLDLRFSPWSRCLTCNVPLEDLARSALPPEWRAKAPPCKELFHCPSCRHVFWEGSHVRRLDQRLASLRSS